MMKSKKKPHDKKGTKKSIAISNDKEDFDKNPPRKKNKIEKNNNDDTTAPRRYPQRKASRSQINNLQDIISKDSITGCTINSSYECTHS